MNSIKLAVLVLLSLAYCVADEKKMDYWEHVKFLNNFPCKEPQPRVFELEDVIPGDILNDKYEGMRDSIKPRSTILHRCSSAGCCKNPTERCMASHTENVTLTFAVVGPKFVEYFDVVASNDTKCTCMQKDVNSIK